MPRLSPADKCHQCRGLLKRQPSLTGATYICEKCDAGDPMLAGEKWIKGELKPPSK